MRTLAMTGMVTASTISLIMEWSLYRRTVSTFAIVRHCEHSVTHHTRHTASGTNIRRHALERHDGTRLKCVRQVYE